MEDRVDGPANQILVARAVGPLEGPLVVRRLGIELRPRFRHGPPDRLGRAAQLGWRGCAWRFREIGVAKRGLDLAMSDVRLGS